MPKDISCGLWPSITILPLRFLGSFALPADAAYKPLTYCVVGLESTWQSVFTLICQLKGEVTANTKRAGAPKSEPGPLRNPSTPLVKPSSVLECHAWSVTYPPRKRPPSAVPGALRYGNPPSIG